MILLFCAVCNKYKIRYAIRQGKAVRARTSQSNVGQCYRNKWNLWFSSIRPFFFLIICLAGDPK